MRAWVEMIKVDSFCSVDTQETSDKGTHETDRSCAAQRIEARVVRCIKFDSQVSIMEEVKLEKAKLLERPDLKTITIKIEEA